MNTEILKKFATFTGHDNRNIEVTIEMFLKDSKFRPAKEELLVFYNE